MRTNDWQIELPASKSLSNRWLVLNYCLNDRIHISNVSTADDTQLLRRLLQQLRSGRSHVFDCHNAGTVARFLMPLLCITPGTHVLTGSSRLCERPFGSLIRSLLGMGFDIQCQGIPDALPVRIVGGQPKRKMAFVDSSDSSQFVSALLLMGPLLESGITVSLSGTMSSRPYIEMTQALLSELKVPVKYFPAPRIFSTGTYAEAKIGPRTITIERDWSSASFFYLAAMLLPNKRIRLSGLPRVSIQGDSIAADIFRHLGVVTTQVRNPYTGATSVCVKGGGPCDKRIDISLRNNPDLFPAVAVACAAAGVSCRLRGLENLRHKECDRLTAMGDELLAMGANLTVTDDCLILRRTTLQPTRPVRTYDDHRMAMAFAPLKFRFPDLEIEHPEVVSKSFPDFWQQLEKLSQ